MNCALLQLIMGNVTLNQKVSEMALILNHCQIGIEVGSLAQWKHYLLHVWNYSTLSPVSIGMGDHIWTSILPQYVTKPTRSTQRHTSLGSAST